jgi:hypothetical protein
MVSNMKIKLIDDWKSAYKWLSVNCMVLAGSIQGAWAAISDDMKQYIPHSLVTGLTIGLLIMGIIGRLIKQSKDDVTTP